MTQNERDDLKRLVLQAYLEDDLVQVVGEALSKDALLISLIDVTGRILVIGNSRSDSPHVVRNRSMIKQMCDLFNENIDTMMKKAGRIERGEET